jgi:hypothetical protein
MTKNNSPARKSAAFDIGRDTEEALNKRAELLRLMKVDLSTVDYMITPDGKMTMFAYGDIATGCQHLDPTIDPDSLDFIVLR